MPSHQAVSIPRTGKRRKITPADIEDMAKLVAKRLTETESALVLGIDPGCWFSFRSRHQLQFDDAYARVRGAAIKAHLEHIEAAQSEDWRASDRLLALKFPERFGQKQETNVQVQIVAGLPNDLLSEIRKRFESKHGYAVGGTGAESKSQALSAAQEQKLLSDNGK